jgi:GTPase SAR1 family protein
MSSISSTVNSKKNNKVILLGDSGVGKTAIIERFTHNKF